MLKPIILQIEGLGIPVLIDTPNEEPELRWSSDPDISADSPAYIFRDSAEIERFLNFAVNKRYINESCLSPIRVTAPVNAVTLSRAECEEQGIDPVNWDIVRVGLIISGNSSHGPVSDSLEWAGQRSDFLQDTHLQDAFKHAIVRKITAPQIVTHIESRQTLDAAEFMTGFQHSIKPQLLNSSQVLERLWGDLAVTDLDSINPDRAIGMLRQIKAAVEDNHTQENRMRKGLGMETKPELASFAAPQSAPASLDSNEHVEPQPIEPTPGPELFYAPRPR